MRKPTKIIEKIEIEIVTAPLGVVFVVILGVVTVVVVVAVELVTDLVVTVSACVTVAFWVISVVGVSVTDVSSVAVTFADVSVIVVLPVVEVVTVLDVTVVLSQFSVSILGVSFLGVSFAVVSLCGSSVPAIPSKGNVLEIIIVSKGSSVSISVSGAGESVTGILTVVSTEFSVVSTTFSGLPTSTGFSLISESKSTIFVVVVMNVVVILVVVGRVVVICVVVVVISLFKKGELSTELRKLSNRTAVSSKFSLIFDKIDAPVVVLRDKVVDSGEFSVKTFRMLLGSVIKCRDAFVPRFESSPKFGLIPSSKIAEIDADSSVGTGGSSDGNWAAVVSNPSKSKRL